MQYNKQEETQINKNIEIEDNIYKYKQNVKINYSKQQNMNSYLIFSKFYN